MEILNYIPVRECEYELKENKVIVLFKNFEKSWLDKIIKPKKEKVAKIELDEIGSYVWLRCDGKKNVNEIIDETKKDFSGDDKIEERTELFFKQLEQKKLIRFYTIK